VIDNPTHFLTPGMFGHLRLLGSGAYPALLIPDQATSTDQTREVVYLVGADDKVAVRAVKLGPLFGGLRVIREGLGPDDRVIIEGVQRAKPGAPVTVRMGRVPPPSTPVAPPPEGYTEPLPTGATAASGPAA
jgi:multidrug efflux pump subunit AcrA (membrane-fusion protein)